MRRLFESQGLAVKRLQRTQIGKIKLGELKPGRWRMLTETEIKTLLHRKYENKLLADFGRDGRVERNRARQHKFIKHFASHPRAVPGGRSRAEHSRAGGGDSGSGARQEEAQGRAGQTAS